jgi:hypothetical protein
LDHEVFNGKLQAVLSINPSRALLVRLSSNSSKIGGRPVLQQAPASRPGDSTLFYVDSPLPAPYQPGEDIIGLVMSAYKAAAVSGTLKACT